MSNIVRRFLSALQTYLHSKSIDRLDQWLNCPRDYVRNPGIVFIFSRLQELATSLLW